MKFIRVYGLLFCIISQALASPAPNAKDGFANFFLNDAPVKESFIVKRKIFEENPDRELKQISLSSLVGDLEKNIFASALSLNKVLTNKDASVPEIKVSDDSELSISKHQSLTKQETNSELVTITTTTEPSAISSVTNRVVLQTTEQISQAVSEPAHIVIDRIAVQPHKGGVAFLPIFELKQTAGEEDTNKDHENTNVTISSDFHISNSTNDANANATETILNSVTTPKGIEDLKEAEEELKEKFAEVEADPVILSARV